MTIGSRSSVTEKSLAQAVLVPKFLVFARDQRDAVHPCLSMARVDQLLILLAEPLCRNEKVKQRHIYIRSLRETAVSHSTNHSHCFPAEPPAEESHSAGEHSGPENLGSVSQARSGSPHTSSLPEIPRPISMPEDGIRDPADYSNSTSDMIRQELASHHNLSSRQFMVLQSALSLVGKFVSSSHNIEHTQQEKGADDANAMPPSDLPHEMFYNLLGVNIHSHWPDHISSKTLERICLVVGDGTASPQLARQYMLCILSKAVIFISRWLRSPMSQGLANSLEKSRNSYITSGLRCLHHIDFTRSPTLPMLQALLSGVSTSKFIFYIPQGCCSVADIIKATLVQLLGQTSRSWVLTSFASRGLVALGYHQLTPALLASQQRDEIRDCIYWCYYMDKTLSMLLVRSSSLPDLPYNPATLVKPEPENPLSYKVKIMVKLAYVQDLYLNALAERQKNRPYPSNLVESLQFELYSVRLEILEVRIDPYHSFSQTDRVKSRPNHTATPILKSEWDAVDFTYFSIACTALRLDSIYLHDHKKREECVQCARKCLQAMQECHAYVSSTSKTTPDSLFWTVLLYPLTPFFVIFCNIVATSNASDLILLKEATATVASIGENFSFSMNLHSLLSQLIHLCSLLENPGRQPSITNTGDITSNDESSVPPNLSISMIAKSSQEDQQLQEPTVSDPASGLHTQTNSNFDYSSLDQSSDQNGSKRNSIWDGGLLWDFFNIQPSVEWFDASYNDFLEPPLD
ncbi:unnamed protein product [Penicillium salamii]|uniref:Xylanolytic transcriptional activator regulatory domain-containing protein n=1 Tax=Penicillium salamii TaxID=1612424 RepID=A0A9W4J9M2_9EURO|nr:unnamed protein product [Penicillium salamii]CAG8103490.1 unnamed protein product [Penicillium salamii]CAG8376473.1 unnamed protein product [Penicillium salamii]CAG8378122.1 unnamed protein product [Penicillium salamii]CAG8379791.1 unnamed protein product [Penicillium salamii]